MTFGPPRRGALAIPLTLFLSWFIVVGFQGCVTPATTPQTTTQQIALARVSLAALYNTATSLSQAGRLSLAQLKGIQSKGDTAEAALRTADIAIAINKNEGAALEALHAAQRILRELDSTVKEASR